MKNYSIDNSKIKFNIISNYKNICYKNLTSIIRDNKKKWYTTNTNLI